jgi:transmembrane sensor
LERDPIELPIEYEDNFRRIIDNQNSDTGLRSLLAIKPSKSPVLRKWWRYAAAVACLVPLGIFTNHYFLKGKTLPENKTAKRNEIVSKSGTRTRLMLPDGSQVWLNSGSKLNYSDDFDKNLREVDLEGEAFFDVTKDAKRPFIVHVSSINIKVVGTAFDVKSYPQDETVETTLLRGIIEVSRKDNPNAPMVILKPNEKLIFSKNLDAGLQRNAGDSLSKFKTLVVGKISVAPVSKAIPDSNKVETSWVYNRLVFDGDSFQELAEKMERWYNVQILFKDKELFRYRFKGAFANETVKEALNALKLTAEFSYEINNNEIVLFKK